MGEGYSKAHWAKDETAKSCRQCAKEFNFSRRRHHCRNCGYVFCGDCSFRTQPVPQRQIKEPVRVCDDCYFTLLRAGEAPQLAQSQLRFAVERNPRDPSVASTTGTAAGGQTQSFNAKQQSAASGGKLDGAPGSATSPLNQNTSPQQDQLPPAMTQDQLLMERLSGAMMQIRTKAGYIDTSVVAVEPLAMDEAPAWAEEQDYRMQVLADTEALLAFPVAAPNTVPLLLGLDVTRSLKLTANDVEKLKQCLQSYEPQSTG